MGEQITVGIDCPACGNQDATITTTGGAATVVLAVDCHVCDAEVMA